ncbi:MAG: MBL fold metallo-hydrolase [Acidimicrobiales bacterium]
MFCERVAPNVQRVSDGVVNCYLVEEGTDLTMVDSAWPRSWPDLQRLVASSGHRPEDVRAVLLTHGHADHMGSAEAARTGLGVPVHSHGAEVPRLTGAKKGGSSFALVPRLLPTLWHPTAWAFTIHAVRRGFLTPRWVGEVVSVSDGETVDVPGHPRLVFAPGHTEGHAAFHLADAGVLLSGDELATRDPLTGRRGPRLMPAALNDDQDAARASLARIALIDAALILPGHGDPWTGTPAAAVEQARQADAGTDRGPGSA